MPTSKDHIEEIQFELAQAEARRLLGQRKEPVRTRDAKKMRAGERTAQKLIQSRHKGVRKGQRRK